MTLALRPMGEVVPCDPAGLHPVIGPSAQRFLSEVRAGADGIPDGKQVVDALLANGIGDFEGLATTGYEQGQTSAQIYHNAVGNAAPYTSERGRLTAIEGETTIDFAKRLRKHQDHTLIRNETEFTVPLTCDGRYDPELYPLDLWPVLNGYHITGDTNRIQDTADLVTLQILKHGYPFNGIRVKERPGSEPKVETNYYAGRSQPPTYFYMIRLLGEHGGDDVYAHKPYVEAMERLWTHYNPAPEDLAGQPRGQFHAYRRGGISPEGLPFSVYGDDTNNGKDYSEYIGRPESHAEDVATARAAVARALDEGASSEEQTRVFAETFVHLQAAGESGHDMSSGRWANGKDLSYINTTNIVPIDLQCELMDAAEVLAYSHGVLKRQAEERGDIEAAEVHRIKQAHFSDDREKRREFVNTYQWNPHTGTYHDLELGGASGPYSSMHTYEGWRQTEVITAASLNTLYSDVASPERAISVINVAREELLGLGGLAVTNVVTGEQWDGPNAWVTTNRIGVTGPIHAAAKFAPSHPKVAEELLDFAEDVRVTSMHGWDLGFENTGGIVETVNAWDPWKAPVAGEYPKDPRDPNSPQNFAMGREAYIENYFTDVRRKWQRLIPVAGRFVVEVT
jgi:hypothetical protein